MCQPIIGQGGHIGFRIDLNSNKTWSRLIWNICANFGVDPLSRPWEEVENVTHYSKMNTYLHETNIYLDTFNDLLWLNDLIIF